MANLRKIGLVIFLLGLLNGQVLGLHWMDGPQHLLNRVEITGNQQTKPEIILRELTFHKDSFYSNDGLKYETDISYRNLMNLNLFNHILIEKHLETVGDKDQWVVEISVIEKWYFWPIPFIEFADRNFNQWYQFDFDTYRTNYGLYLFRYNAFGRNQTIKLSLINGYNREIGFQYRVPWFFQNKKLGLNLQMRTRTNREVWYKTENNQVQFFRDLDHQILKRHELNAQVTIRPKTNIWHIPFFGYQYHQVSDTISEHLNPEFLSSRQNHLNIFAAGYRFLLEKRNNKLFPTKGHMIQSTLGYNFLNEGLSYPYVSAELSAFKAMSNKLSNAFNIAFRNTWAKSLPYVQARALGYDHSVRGYEAYVVDGQSFGLFKYELRWHLLDDQNFNLKYMPLKSYKSMPVGAMLNLFVDQGYVQNRINQFGNNLTNQYLLGYGVGLSTVFYYDKVFRFEYSFNKMGEHGLRIHFNKSF